MSEKFIQITLFVLAVVFLIGASVDWLMHHNQETFGGGIAIACVLGYLGFGVSEDTSGGKPKRMGITKTGNGHVRRVLIESAWHYRHRPMTGEALRKRRKGQPARVIAIAEKAQQRLNRRYVKLTDKGKHPNAAVTAVARELTGFLWAALNPEAAGTLEVKASMGIPA